MFLPNLMYVYNQKWPSVYLALDDVCLLITMNKKLYIFQNSVFLYLNHCPHFCNYFFLTKHQKLFSSLKSNRLFWMTLRENMRELRLKECQVADPKLSSSQNQEESLNELVLRIIQGIFKSELWMYLLFILYVIVQMTCWHIKILNKNKYMIDRSIHKSGALILMSWRSYDQNFKKIFKKYWYFREELNKMMIEKGIPKNREFITRDEV